MICPFFLDFYYVIQDITEPGNEFTNVDAASPIFELIDLLLHSQLSQLTTTRHLFVDGVSIQTTERIRV